MLLVIDNYDSFTWNLVQILGELGGDPVVLRNDSCTVEEVVAMSPERVVISPGPCTPSDAGISVELIRRLPNSVPLLGVCLGHQAIGEAFGGRTIRSRRVMHGKTAAIRHTGQGLFEGLSSPLTVTRYHSLVTSPQELPDVLEPVAWSAQESEDVSRLEPETRRFGRALESDEATGAEEGGAADEIQALRHRQRPVWGVQFHPESFFSEGGGTLLANFLRM
ncbi:MAG: aminodeoxychorismate/anthranilate synthase component II [Gemmatimonadota bacterium]